MSIVTSLMSEYRITTTTIPRKIEILKLLRSNLQVALINLSSLHTYENGCSEEHIKIIFAEAETMRADILSEVNLPDDAPKECIAFVKQLNAFATYAGGEINRQKECCAFKVTWFSFNS